LRITKCPYKVRLGIWCFIGGYIIWVFKRNPAKYPCWFFKAIAFFQRCLVTKILGSARNIRPTRSLRYLNFSKVHKTKRNTALTNANFALVRVSMHYKLQQRGNMLLKTIQIRANT
jgi:hypothetical protein